MFKTKDGENHSGDEIGKSRTYHTDRVFIGGLKPEITENELELLVIESECLAQKIIIVKDRFTNECRGFGFIELSSDEEARRFIAKCDNKIFQGRKLKVYFAQRRILL